MIKVAISHCPDLLALQAKLKTLYEAEEYPDHIGKTEEGNYVVLRGLRMPLRYSEDGLSTFGLFKCNPYDEDGNLTGIMKAVHPEIEILQWGTNKSRSDCPWDKLTEEQWQLLEEVAPRQPLLDEYDEPTGDLQPRVPYGQCATAVVE